MHRTGGSLRDPRAITDRRSDEERQRCQPGCWATVDHMGRRPDGPRLRIHRRGRDQQETRNPKRLLPMGKSLARTVAIGYLFEEHSVGICKDFWATPIGI